MDAFESACENAYENINKNLVLGVVLETSALKILLQVAFQHA
jgi:hypothetical protein